MHDIMRKKWHIRDTCMHAPRHIYTHILLYMLFHTTWWINTVNLSSTQSLPVDFNIKLHKDVMFTIYGATNQKEMILLFDASYQTHFVIPLFSVHSHIQGWNMFIVILLLHPGVLHDFYLLVKVFMFTKVSPWKHCSKDPFTDPAGCYWCIA